MVVSRKLYEHTCPHCSNLAHPVAEAILPPEFIKQLKPETVKLIQNAYDNKKYNGVLSIIGKMLTNQVHDSYKTITPDWKTPDIEMLHRLTRDVWSFSAAKDWQQSRDLTLALRDDKGKLREFDAFKEAARKICDKYNETWLQTEYNMSIAASQNAARWTQFTADKDDIPFLQYQTVGDSSVRASHALLDGIVRKVNDSFWATHYPPNGWGCRCEVIQAVGAKEQSVDIPNVPIPEIFRTNLAQTGLVFPKNHPYYDGITHAEIIKAIAYLPPDNTFVTYDIGDGHIIDIHPLHGKDELKKNVETCNILMKHDPKAKIKLMPIIDVNEKTKATDIDARKKYYGNEYQRKYPLKNADAIYNGKVCEFESPNGSKKSIQHAVEHGIAQADKVIIHIPDNIKMDYAIRVVNGHIAHYPNHKNEIWIMNNSELVQYKRQKR